MACDIGELVSAIEAANANDAQDTYLQLAPCDYKLTEVDNHAYGARATT